MEQGSPADPINRPRPSRPGVEVVGILLVLMVGVLTLSWWASAPGRVRVRKVVSTPGQVAVAYGDFVGDLACRECHQAAFEAHQRSGHSRTLRPANAIELAAWLDGRSVVDPERPDVTWTYEFRDASLSVIREDASTSETERQLIEFAFGSGHHATTFLTVTDRDPATGTAREHRLTYFAHSESLGITPGQMQPNPGSGTNPHGRDLTPELTQRCFSCHATLTSTHDYTQLDVETLIPNVGCERCHGAGKDHIEAARQRKLDLRMPFGREGQGRLGWTASGQMALCGACHRLPDMAPRDAIRPDNAELARFQPVSMMQSRCYTRSGGRLTCMSCHDPHEPAWADRPSYDGACLSCHAPARDPGVECPVSPTGGCIECHMPRRDSGQGILFSDHWIRVHHDRTTPLEAAATERPGVPDS